MLRYALIFLVITLLAIAFGMFLIVGCGDGIAEKQADSIAQLLTAEQQVEAVVKKLQELNPDFDGQVSPTIENGVVVGLQFCTDNVTDISPVRALVGLKRLDCFGSSVSFSSDSPKSRLVGTGKLTDLSPLKGMPLTDLNCQQTQVTDLTPLSGMPLTALICGQTQVSDLTPLKGMNLRVLNVKQTLVSDLTPLKGMSLESLVCQQTQVSDLTPLKGMPLESLACEQTQVSDLTPLKGMPLVSLWCKETKVSNLSPLKGMPLTDLNCQQTQVTDLTPLKVMPLKTLSVDFSQKRDAAILRSIKTLKSINGKPAAEFWKEVDEPTAEKKP